jgi:hypothetical protein
MEAIENRLDQETMSFSSWSLIFDLHYNNQTDRETMSFSSWSLIFGL